MSFKTILRAIFVIALIANGQLYAKPAKRIIALSPHAVEMLFAIGAGERIVGTVEYADYPQAALKIPRVGNFTGIQIERVIELQPDLIVGWKSGNQPADLKKLKSLGFNLFYTHPQTISEISDDLIKLGQLTGLQEQARLAADNVNKHHIEIKQKYINKAKVKVFYQLWHDPLRSVGAGSWIESLIKDCQGTNLLNDATSPYPLISLESVLVKDPQVIIIPHHSGNTEDKQAIWKNWSMIDAVKNKRLFTINGDLLHRFSPRAIEGLEKLCQAIDSARK